MENKTLVLNLLGGPGIGKSILAAKLFAALKEKGISCDTTKEMFKEYQYEEHGAAMADQIKVFGDQQFQITSKVGKLQVIVCDSPIILPAVYYKGDNTLFRNFVVKEFYRYNNLNVYIERDYRFAYEQNGRYQNLEGAKIVDEEVRKFIDECGISYHKVTGIGPEVVEELVEIIIEVVNNGWPKPKI